MASSSAASGRCSGPEPWAQAGHCRSPPPASSFTAVLIFRLWRAPLRPGAGPALFRSRYYIAAVALELIALNVAGNLLRRYGLASYLLTSVGIIVGLHFIGLWLATRMPRFLWIAGAMCAISTLAAFLPAASAGFDPRNAATGFANAVVLWIGASY